MKTKLSFTCKDPGTIEDYMKRLVAKGTVPVSMIRPSENVIVDSLTIIPVREYPIER